ncbi:iron-containing alcohol dehydrogenase [Alicyclobacillaceae bacterium I2511]|nr:iron-containing alcohol dehydrogenase [Alicyclobacillaceae bacterium I2511]
MTYQFTYFMPTQIVFGPGTLRELAHLDLPGEKALIVTSSGKSMKTLGYLDRVRAYLKERKIESVVFDKIIPNPISDHVEEGAQVARENQCDFVIGLGGGSSIDSAKSIAVMAKNPGEYWDYIVGGSGQGKEVKNGALPIVAITTTAGTGTEADPWTVITHSDTQEKIGFGCQYTFPTLSIVDPELMRSVPPQWTAYQGMDAFFHAVEGYLANVHQPASDVHALDAVRRITQFLSVAVNDGQNLQARTEVAWANTAAGIVESLSSCISHHSMEHAASAYHPELPHGAGLISLSVPYFTFMASKSPNRFIALAEAMGEKVEGNEMEQAYAFITGLKKLIQKIGMEHLRLADFGVQKEEAERLAHNARETMGGLFHVDPYPLSHEEVVSLYEACFD